MRWRNLRLRARSASPIGGTAELNGDSNSNQSRSTKVLTANNLNTIRTSTIAISGSTTLPDHAQVVDDGGFGQTRGARRVDIKQRVRVLHEAEQHRTTKGHLRINEEERLNERAQATHAAACKYRLSHQESALQRTMSPHARALRSAARARGEASRSAALRSRTNAGLASCLSCCLNCLRSSLLLLPLLPETGEKHHGSIFRSSI